MSVKPTPITADRSLTLREVLEGLLRQGWLTREQATELMSLGNGKANKHPLVQIAERNWTQANAPEQSLTLECLTEWLAEYAGLSYHRIDPLGIDVGRISSVMGHAYATRLGVLPVKITATEITFATCQPFLREWEHDISRLTRRNILRVVANPKDIERYQLEFYALARSVKASTDERGQAEMPGALRNLEQLIELGRSGRLDGKDQHVINIVDWLLQFAFDQRASDIHLEPRRDLSLVRFRIDGILHEVYQLPSPVMAAVISRLKILSRMDLAEKRRPQDGRIKTRSPEGREVELRAASLPTAFGEKLVLRIFDPEVLVKDFSQLGFSDQDRQHWQQMIGQSEGIILVTGPTGSGKTTTLYSTLRQLATTETNVCTIEDPIELVEPAFNQMQVQTHIDLSFAEGVRALMRQDPDIIMVGEVRDQETADVAIQAALTGHLVLASMHTNDAPSAITRLLNLGVPAFLLQATVLGVVAQRLVRKLCPHCRQATPTDSGLWEGLCGGWQLPKPPQVFEAVGCLECRGTGYFGRSGIYEIMPMTATLKADVTETTDLAQMRAKARTQGMLPLRIAGALKVAAGITSIDEVLKAAPAPPLT